MQTVADFLHGRGTTPNHKTLAPYLDHPAKLRFSWVIEALRKIRASLGYDSDEEQLYLPV